MTDYYFLQGKGKWVNPWKPDAEYGAYQMVLYPDQKSLDIIHKLKEKGIKNVLGKDDDGYYMKFRRPAERKVDGRMTGMAPPEVIDAKGLPFKDLIGNGSDVTVKLEGYNHRVPGDAQGKRSGYAVRWAALRVDNHVPFVRKDIDPTTAKTLEGMDEQEPLF